LQAIDPLLAHLLRAWPRLSLQRRLAITVAINLSMQADSRKVPGVDAVVVRPALRSGLFDGAVHDLERLPMTEREDDILLFLAAQGHVQIADCFGVQRRFASRLAAAFDFPSRQVDQILPPSRERILLPHEVAGRKLKQRAWNHMASHARVLLAPHAAGKNI
jgi:hypothetical protein